MSRMSLDARKVYEKRSNKEGFKIKGCMTQHIFEYSRHLKTLYNREKLCKSEECFKFFILPRIIKRSWI